MAMMDRFTKRAKQVLADAQQEAHRFGHDYSDTEHLLLGLIQNRGVAGDVLRELGVDLQRARSAVEFVVGQGEGASDYVVELTDRAKQVIEYAVDEARKLHHHYVGPEHLLLGLIRHGEGVASGVLELLGIRLDQVAPAVWTHTGIDEETQRALVTSAQNQGFRAVTYPSQDPPQRNLITWLLAGALGAALVYITRLQRALQAARQRGDTYRDLLGELDRERNDQP